MKKRRTRTGCQKITYYGDNKDVESLCNLTTINVMSMDPAVDHFATRFSQRSHGSVTTASMYLDNFSGSDVFLNITNRFRELHGTISDCHLAIIEHQYQDNYDMIRVAQHVITYLTTVYPSLIVSEIPSQAKYRVLGMPKGLTPYKRKQWSVTKCRELLSERGDYLCDKILDECTSKLDDLAETVTQEEAWFILTGIRPYC